MCLMVVGNVRIELYGTTDLEPYRHMLNDFRIYFGPCGVIFWSYYKLEILIYNQGPTSLSSMNVKYNWANDAH